MALMIKIVKAVAELLVSQLDLPKANSDDLDEAREDIEEHMNKWLPRFWEDQKDSVLSRQRHRSYEDAERLDREWSRSLEDQD